MPPRYKYWTILIDQQPTAFRAQTRDELLPTLYQLRRKSPDSVLKWFERGRLWDSPDDARMAELRRRDKRRPRERAGRDDDRTFRADRTRTGFSSERKSQTRDARRPHRPRRSR